MRPGEYLITQLDSIEDTKVGEIFCKNVFEIKITGKLRGQGETIGHKPPVNLALKHHETSQLV